MAWLEGGKSTYNIISYTRLRCFKFFYDIVSLLNFVTTKRLLDVTRLVVHHRDADPLLMPHTISDRSFHQASHFHVLRRNVRDGDCFACVPVASWQDLLRVFPQAGSRAVTILNMVSPRYFLGADSWPTRVDEILRTRANGHPDLHLVLMGMLDSPSEMRRELVALGTHVAARYLPERVLPQWGAFLSAMNLQPNTP